MAIIEKNTPTNYQAIACALHSEYERLIMRKKFTTISWKGSDEISHQEDLLPYDLLASKGEEFLLAKMVDGSLRKIRLDYIVSIKGVLKHPY